MGACTSPSILRVVYFFLLLIDVVKIVVPIGLIILGIVGFSKSVASSDEKEQKKTVTLFFKRIMYAVLIFAVPWIIEVLMVTLGDLMGGEDVNFTDCLDNANSECIEALDSENLDNIKKFCDVSENFEIVESENNSNNNQNNENQEKCWYCPSKKEYYWGVSSPLEQGNICPGTSDTNWFINKNYTEETCK